MAVFTALDYEISVDGTDLSDHIKSVSTPISVEPQDSTAFGDTSRAKLGGLKDSSVTIEFMQDFAASEVDASLWPLLGTVVNVIVTPTTSAVSATNPAYTFPVLISDYTPFSNSVGDLATLSVTFPGSGDVTRTTA